MYILLNSIMSQWISLSDCKNEKSLSKNGAQSPKKLDMHDLARLMMWKQVKQLSQPCIEKLMTIVKETWAPPHPLTIVAIIS